MLGWLLKRLPLGRPPVPEDEPIRMLGRERSPQWPAVRAKWLKDNGTCEVCGTQEDLQVHHVQVVHLYPGRELDPTNFMTLCQPHHIWVGHLGSWFSWNCRARMDATDWLRRIKSRPETIKTQSGTNP